MIQTVNITIGLVANYCQFPNVQLNRTLVSNFVISKEESNAQLPTVSAATYFPDIAAMAAVDVINNDRSALPGIHVNVKRFSDCGGWYPGVADDYDGASGGLAASEMFTDIFENNPDVIGIVGNEYSTTALGIAQELSHVQIPYCSGASASPVLSNKEIYPYFYRTITALGIGDHISCLLSEWNVNRVAIIYQQDDSLGAKTALEDMAIAFENNDVSVLTTLPLSSDFNQIDVVYTKSLLELADARYIVLSGQSSFNSAFYKASATIGLTGPEYVWIGYVEMIEEIITDTSILAGFIKFEQPPTRKDSVIFESFNEIFFQLSGLNSSSLSDESFYYTSSAFDCVMMMLKGFDKLLNQSDSITSESLARRSLNNFMNYTLFKNLSYSGLVADPVLLNSFGDLNAPYYVTYYTGENLTLTAFGRTDPAATNFVYFDGMRPVFSGGSSIPPPDGYHRSVFDFGAQYRTVIICLVSLGVIASFLCVWFLTAFRRHPDVKASGVQFSHVIIVGSLIGYTAMLNEVITPSKISCQAKTWLLVSCYCVMISPIVFKNIYILLVFRTEKNLKIEVIRCKMYMCNSAVILLEIVLLILLSYYSEMDVAVQHFETFDMSVCVESNKSNSFAAIISVLFAYNALIYVCLIVLITKVKHLWERWNESWGITLVTTSVGASYLAIMSTLNAQNSMNGMKRCLILFAAIVCVLSFTIGFRMRTVLYEYYEKNASVLKASYSKIHQRSESFASFATGRSDQRALVAKRPISAGLSESPMLPVSSRPLSTNLISPKSAIFPRSISTTLSRPVSLSSNCVPEIPKLDFLAAAYKNSSEFHRALTGLHLCKVNGNSSMSRWAESKVTIDQTGKKCWMTIIQKSSSLSVLLTSSCSIIECLKAQKYQVCIPGKCKSGSGKRNGLEIARNGIIFEFPSEELARKFSSELRLAVPENE